MKERLYIKDFGPIKEIDIELKPLMLFIGPQASGKSTIAKVLYFIKAMKNDLLSYALTFDGVDDGSGLLFPFFKAQRKKFVDTFGTTRNFKPFVIRFEFHNRWIEIRLNDAGFVQVEFDTQSFESIREALFIAQKYNQHKTEEGPAASGVERRLASQREAEFRKNLKHLFNALYRANYEESIYVPAGRSFLTVLTDQLRSITDSGIDLVNREFVDLIATLRPVFTGSLADVARDWKTKEGRETDGVNLGQVEGLIEAILKGSYRYVGGVESIINSADDSGSAVKINFASSGQQESVWILLILYFLLLTEAQSFCVIEEPEAHLFPSTQRDIVNLLALFKNANDNQVVITTHSPYILEALNVLILASDAGQVNRAYTSELTNHACWLSYEDCAAFLVNDGIISSIAVDDLRQLDALAVDEISGDLNEAYQALSNIMYGTDESTG